MTKRMIIVLVAAAMLLLAPLGCKNAPVSIDGETLYQQMNARLYRQGQKAEAVVIIHIVTKGTVDSRVLKALSEKDRIQEALIDAVKAEVKA